MKKQQLQLIILLGILLAAIGGYFGLKAYNEKQSNIPIESTEISVFTVSLEDITAFSYDYEGISYSFIKENDNWIYEGDTSMDIDESLISSMLGNLDDITSDTAITDVTDYEQYGLATPARTVSLTVAGQEHKLYFGDYNDIIYKYYLQVDGQDTVYTTSGYRYTAFDVLPDDLIVVEEEAAE